MQGQYDETVMYSNLQLSKPTMELLTFVIILVISSRAQVLGPKSFLKKTTELIIMNAS